MTHLELLNVVLAWRFRQPGWPTAFLDTGYVVYAVGVGVVLPDGSKIAPDVLASAPERGFSALVEVKGGRDVAGDQLRRMEAVTPTDLRDSAHLRVADPGTHRIQPVYLCNQDCFDDVARSVAGHRAAVVGFDGQRFVLGAAPLEDGELARTLQGAAVPPGAQPLAIVPFDHESHPAAITRHVLAEVVAALVHGAGAVSAESIVQGTHYVVYEMMRATGAKSELRLILTRVAEILQDAAANEFSDWLARAGKERIWRPSKSLPSDQSSKTRELKTLARAAEQMVERLGGPAAGGMQLPLIDVDALPKR